LSVYSVGYEAPVSDWHGSAMELADRATNVLNLVLSKTDLGKGGVILCGLPRGESVAPKTMEENRVGAFLPPRFGDLKKLCHLHPPGAAQLPRANPKLGHRLNCVCAHSNGET